MTSYQFGITEENRTGYCIQPVFGRSEAIEFAAKVLDQDEHLISILFNTHECDGHGIFQLGKIGRTYLNAYRIR